MQLQNTNTENSFGIYQFTNYQLLRDDIPTKIDKIQTLVSDIVTKQTALTKSSVGGRIRITEKCPISVDEKIAAAKPSVDSKICNSEIGSVLEKQGGLSVWWITLLGRHLLVTKSATQKTVRCLIC